MVAPGAQDPRDFQYAMEMLALLEWDDPALDSAELQRRSAQRPIRMRSRRRLASFLSGSWTSGSVQHSCGLGCCRNREDTETKLFDLIMDTYMTSLPPVPAINRWTKLYPALSWWTVALKMHGMIKQMWGYIYCFAGDGDDAEPHALMQDMLHPEEDELQRQLNAARARKTWRWVKHPLTEHELLIACLVLRPVMNMMGWLFRSEASTAHASVSVLLKDNNPAAKTMQYLFAKLLDLDHQFWYLYSFSGWSNDLLQLALGTLLRLVGALWWRISYRTLQYPWALWRAVDPDESRAERAKHVDLLMASCDECVDKAFSAKVKQRVAVAEDLLNLDTVLAKSVRMSFQKCRATNILSETTLARVTGQLWSSKKGRSAALSTMACRNTLADIRQAHQLARVAWNRKHGRPDEADLEVAPTAPPPSRKACSAWHRFLAKKRSEGLGMSAIGAAWREVSAEERSALEEEATEFRRQVIRMTAAIT